MKIVIITIDMETYDSAIAINAGEEQKDPEMDSSPEFLGVLGYEVRGTLDNMQNNGWKLNSFTRSFGAKILVDFILY